MSLVFQQMECDYTIIDAPYSSPKALENGTPESKMAIIRMFGLTMEGHSVMLNIYGFLPYFYIAVPPHPSNVEDWDLCKAVQNELNTKLRGRVRTFEQVDNYVLSVDIVQKESIMAFHNNQKIAFFKITMALPKHVTPARDILEEQGINVPGVGMRVFQTYESNIVFALRFMIDRGVQGVSWIELPAKKWVHTQPHISTCQLEVDCFVDDFIAHAPDGEWIKTPPLRILSFDIECAGRENAFPVAELDPVIQIANIISTYGEPPGTENTRNIFVLGSCTPIVGADVRSFETEADMLRGWKQFVVESDPDVIIGYNIINFDIPYLFDRARHLKINDFPMMSRVKNAETKIKNGMFSSKAYGTKESKEIGMFGRTFFDLLQVVQRDHKLRSFTLNSVSAEFLGEQKEDVHYSIISKLHNGSADDRRRLAVYCLKDAYLPTRLMEKLMSLLNYIEMARVTGVPFSYLLLRGQSIKVLSQLYRQANSEGLIIPHHKKVKEEMASTYEGATVIPPIKGFYDVPITTLDFASLYPSIMMAHNLCYTTLTSKTYCESQLQKDEYVVTPAGFYFVRAQKRKGVLPRILEQLIQQRGKAKKDMASETDPFRYAALNARQLALKISANSVYGFTGATIGSLPCIEVSASTTAFGREMIEFTAKTIREEYCISNGYKHDAVVIYGDTDSVMVKFGTSELKEAMEFGKKAAHFVSERFTKPISLEFEKVYFPYLLISKKRYAGLFWTREDKYDKMDAKGLETVRRDNCLLVKRVIDTCLRGILIERNIDAAVAYCKDTIRDLLRNRLDISMLVITKALSKSEKEYKGKQAHVELNKKIEKRGDGTGYHLGDRIPYVIRSGVRGSTASERAEDPIFALENNIPLDTQYYIDMLSRPLMRIFKPILQNPAAELFQGDHMKDVSIPTPKTGAIMGFTRVQASCQGCRVTLQAGEETLCKLCLPKAPLFYSRQLDVVCQKEREFGRLWTQCQNCQGSLHQEVLCTARDCPIFYMRTKVAMDLRNSRAQLEKFDIEW
jgi:DNA polymerase delta subunit 1